RRAADDGDPYDLAFVDASVADDGEIGGACVRDTRVASTRLILLRSIPVQPGEEGRSPAGYSYFLSKPIRQSYLFDCIAAALHRTTADANEAAHAPPESAPVSAPARPGGRRSPRA